MLTVKLPPHMLPQSKSDWMFSIHSRDLQADWSILEYNENTTLDINVTSPIFW